MMEGWGALVSRRDSEICGYDLHGESNPCRSHGSAMVYLLCYSYIKILYYILSTGDYVVTVTKRRSKKNIEVEAKNIVV